MFTLRRGSLTKTPYLVLSAPALLLEYWLDSIARPAYDSAGNLTKAGEDLDAPGLTEFMWDVIYWTWINLVLVAVLGGRLWWAYLLVPGYAAYKGITTLTGVKQMLGGLGAATDQASGADAGQSNRQKKLEKRSGQKVMYR